MVPPTRSNQLVERDRELVLYLVCDEFAFLSRSHARSSRQLILISFFAYYPRCEDEFWKCVGERFVAL